MLFFFFSLVWIMYVRSSTKIPNFVLIKETSMTTLGNFLFLLAVTLKMCETMGPNDLLHSAYDVCEVLLKDSGSSCSWSYGWLDLQLPVQSVLISTKFKSGSWRGVHDITLCYKVCQWLATDQWFSSGTPVSSTNKTDCHDITEILLKVALNTIKPTNI